MTEEELNYIILYNFCCSDKPEKVKELLEEHPELDTTKGFDNLFSLTISHDLKGVLEVLLEHYVKTKLQGDDNSIEYKAAKNKIINVIQEAGDAYLISDAAREMIGKYNIPIISILSEEQEYSNSEHEREFAILSDDDQSSAGDEILGALANVETGNSG